MPDSIKQQIIARVVTDLTPLVTNETFRSLTRESDRLRETKSLPALMIADGQEVPFQNRHRLEPADAALRRYHQTLSRANAHRGKPSRSQKNS